MTLEILTPDKIFYKGEVISITVPGSMGSFQVFNEHAPIISTLENGYLLLRTTTSDEKFFIRSGFIKVLSNKTVVLAETIVSS